MTARQATERAGPFLIVAALAAVALATRTAMPIDETRYLAVAWEMWQRGDFLVPHLNGAPYSHKPPLLFWLVHAGWAVAGVNDVWPRLVLPLCAAATVLVTLRTARALWPDRPWLAPRSAWILAGTALYALYATLLMFDVLLGLAVAIGLLGLVRAASGHARGFVVLALGIGLGALAKGPAVLLHLLPAALLAPWWAGRGALRPARWTAGVLLAVAGGAAIGLAWALPAARAGGEAYRDAILWGQTAHRMVEAFAHQRPAWWYMPWLPLALAPWLAWRPLWDAARARGLRADRGVRLALASALPALAAFSLVSGKQLHYLLPQVPAVALAVARGLDEAPRPRRAWLAALGLAGLGVAVLVAPQLRLPAAAALAGVHPAGALAFFALAGWVAAARRAPSAQVPRLAVASALALATAYAVFVRPLAPAWDLRPLAASIRALQDAGTPVAHDGEYHGQYQFAGRLRRPLPELGDVALARAWIAAHPQGALVVAFRDPAAPAAFHAVAAQPFRGRYAALVTGEDRLPAVEASRAEAQAHAPAIAGAGRRRPPR